MITLDLNLSYLSKYYNISSSSLEMYRNKSIKEIMELEAEKGNPLAAGFMMQITKDPSKLVELFQLVNPRNRFLILSNMNKDDLTNIMALLEPYQIVLGLSIFNQEMIIALMKKLEPEALSKVVLKKMSPDKFLKSIPEKYMDEFLNSNKIDRNILNKGIMYVDEYNLQKMMEKTTGQACYEDKDTILKKMSSMKDDEYKNTILNMEVEGKRELILGILKEKPELFQEFSADAMTFPFRTMEKEEILKSLTVLETEELLPMVEDLPQEVMTLIATQIDPKVFAQVLVSDFKDIIAECGI